jgi:hypothetical protein
MMFLSSCTTSPQGSPTLRPFRTSADPIRFVFDRKHRQSQARQCNNVRGSGASSFSGRDLFSTRWFGARATVYCSILIGVCICFEYQFDTGWRDALQSDNEHVTVRRCVFFFIPFLPPLLIPHGR